MRVVENPILPGFHPDPSLCRVGDDFFLATSTFEWFPGVEIHRSRDLVNWTPAARPLDRVELLDLRGVQSSGGVWAPCLSWAAGRFWLIYTNVGAWRGEPRVDHGAFKDTPNFLTTAPAIEGPWSAPVELHASGFDPSLFHDDDGRHWLVSMRWDYRAGRNPFSGIVVQEFDAAAGALVGPSRVIWHGTDLGSTEGPHLYRRGGWYYLLCAEGGTGYGHAVTMVRSRSLEGPWDQHPWHPLLQSLPDRSLLKVLEGSDFLSDHAPPLPDGFHQTLQKAGHASLAPWTDDEWILAHLCGRPLPGTAHCPLGRETALQRVLWKDDGWPYPESRLPRTTTAFSGSPVARRSDRSWVDAFDGPGWHPAFQSLRTPLGADADLASRPGWLRLRGRQGPTSTLRQSVLACRVRDFHWKAETHLDFAPTSFQHLAGLIVRYDERHQAYARLSWDEERATRTLGLLVFVGGAFAMPLGPDEIDVGPQGPVGLRAEGEGRNLRFSWEQEPGRWQTFGPTFDLARFSDEHPWPMAFTGLFVGLAAHDLSGTESRADFAGFSYEEGTS